MRLAKSTRNALLGTLAFTLAPTAALAAAADTTYEERDNDDFDVGLLGLLGLAGLVGLKRKDDHRGNTRR
jgi:hypothetical protein